MISRSFTRTRLVALASLTLALLGIVAAYGLEQAIPVSMPFTPATSTTDIIRSNVGPARVTLNTGASAVPLGGTFDFSASVTSTQTLEYLQARMKVFRPSGTLMYQETFVDELDNKGRASFDYKRSTADLGLTPGVYPAELSIRVSAAGEVTETAIATEMLVYDPETDPLPVALVARVSPQPLTDAEGRFVSDPAQFTRARDDVVEIAEWVLDDPDARIGLCLSPMMLEEWQRIADGYSFEGAEGEIVVAAGDDVPLAYAGALNAITRARATGRLELMSLGFSDPDLSELSAAGLVSDVRPQYTLGIARITSATEASPSVGTAPAGAAVPQNSLSALEANGIEYAVVSQSHVTIKGESVASGAYQAAAGKFAVLAADTQVARSLAGSPTAELRPLLFDRYMPEREGRCLPVLVEVGPGGLQAGQLLSAAEFVSSQPWLSFALPDQARGTASTKARTRAHRPDKDAPPDYWKTVADSREWASALVFSLGTDSNDAARAGRSSLVAQSSVWSGFGGRWTLAGRGLNYAASARRSADRVFDRVTLNSKPITLAGASGRVPVTIVNDTEEHVRVTLTAKADSALEVEQGAAQLLDLEPGENFVEIPVSLNNSLKGRLDLGLQAAGVEFASTTVTLRASYLDRVAIIAGILVVLIGLLGYIIVRVRRAENDATEDPQR